MDSKYPSIVGKKRDLGLGITIVWMKFITGRFSDSNRFVHIEFRTGFGGRFSHYVAWGGQRWLQ
jgi:hypothetical protein